MADDKKPKHDPKKDKGGDGKKGDEKVTQDMRDMAMDYGWAMSVFHEFPELMDIFKQAVHNTWSVSRFQAEVQDSAWFKKHSDTWRTNTYLKLTDPTTYDERVAKVQRGLQDAAGSLGIDFKNHKQLAEMSEQAFLHGWDETKINNVLARMVQINGQHEVGGDLASMQDRLNAYALANGIKVTDHTMQGWLRSVVRGSGTEQEFQNYIQRQAAAMFPNWKKEIDAGMTVADIAEPYRQRMADLLEINPNQIDLTGKLMRNALSSKDEKGQWQSMSLADFEDQVRKDSRWQYTDNAREQMSNVVAGLMQSFGVIG